jgi:Xaa-Pro aminopeptidase
MIITLDEYQQRRLALMSQIPEDAIVIIPGASDKQRNHDVCYPFRQNSDFWYLTGFNEAHAILVLIGGESPRSIIFCQPFCSEKEIWTGPLLGVENAAKHLGVDDAFSIADFETLLLELLQGRRTVYYPFLHAGKWEKPLFSAWKRAREKHRGDASLHSAFVDVSPLLAELRLCKSPQEIQCMQYAIDASVSAHIKVMEGIGACHYEYQALALFQQHLLNQGLCETAYPSIVASGPNACVLHYTQYQRAFQSHDLLLIDAGAEWQGYAADITRTYPTRGQWTFEQEALYDLVLESQLQAIAMIRPGVVWTDIQLKIVQILTQGLKDLGILHGDVNELIATQAYKEFYMHSSGHWLGLDVHDAGAYQIQGQARILAEHMVLTVEPGLYISPRHEKIDKRWRGIGIRIEDDVLILPGGHKVLSEKLPKTREDIKAVMLNAYK